MALGILHNKNPQVENFDRICRSCLCENPEHNIFSYTHDGHNLVAIVKTLFCDVILCDSLPL